jgi:hypothetical protein
VQLARACDSEGHDDSITASRTLIIGESIRRRVLLTVFVERHEGWPRGSVCAGP